MKIERVLDKAIKAIDAVPPDKTIEQKNFKPTHVSRNGTEVKYLGRRKGTYGEYEAYIEKSGNVGRALPDWWKNNAKKL